MKLLGATTILSNRVCHHGPQAQATGIRRQPNMRITRIFCPKMRVRDGNEMMHRVAAWVCNLPPAAISFIISASSLSSSAPVPMPPPPAGDINFRAGSLLFPLGSSNYRRRQNMHVRSKTKFKWSISGLRISMLPKYVHPLLVAASN